MESALGAFDFSTFNIQLARECARLSELAYDKFEVDRDSFAIKLQGLGYELIETFYCKETDTQAFLAKNSSFAILAFRGTEMNYIDILTDLKASLDENYRGHTGFFAGYESVRVQLSLALDQLGDIPLIFTGHSLGGALAKAALLTEVHRTNVVSCYTFGSPPVCEKARCSETKVPVFLLVNQSDIVPRAMFVGSVFSKPLLWLVKKTAILMAKMKFKNDEVIRLFKALDDLRPDLVKYDHFPGILLMEGSGKLRPLKESSESVAVFLQMAFRDWKKVFEDHRVRGYLVGVGD